MFIITVIFHFTRRITRKRVTSSVIAQECNELTVPISVF